MLRFVLWILLLGAVVYAIFWILDRRARPGGDNRGGGFGGLGGFGVRPGPSGPRGPDDDEAFLRDLDWRRRKAQRETQKETQKETQRETQREGQREAPSESDDGSEPPRP